MTAVTMDVAAAPPRKRMSEEKFWAIVLIAPYVVVFALFVVYPVLYGFWLGSSANSFKKLFQDPIFVTTLWNTAIFVLVAVNLKMLVALGLSAFFILEYRWVRWLSVIFIIAWAMPSIPTILSVRWMFNPEWGLVNNLLFKWFQIEGPGWLTERHYGLTLAILMHIWKSLPFWTLILVAARLAIPRDLYESADVDGATRWQRFRFITWPAMRAPYMTSVLLSSIWTLGDFNSVYLLTGGGPNDSTQVLATLGVRYLRIDQIDVGMAAVICALPAILPMVFFLMKRLSRVDEQ
ncbi:carbohydrate ABC transporter permease [Reyranella sp. CPCC 100927]|uniref:carbohydrate ABC transporter permease n=1 Tax=Reyranella sp. CPCC 100927 TaxID=2599616 RepID=UPI0011B5DF80|nr:sugar ABC transporter permease [Reyranella sp. CPCC 100927]TWT09410.1 sugar ABC transporter permease [Reyranella sp. CPCC 100927]